MLTRSIYFIIGRCLSAPVAPVVTQLTPLQQRLFSQTKLGSNVCFSTRGLSSDSKSLNTESLGASHHNTAGSSSSSSSSSATTTAVAADPATGSERTVTDASPTTSGGGWLKGPQNRQRAVLQEEWVEATDQSGQKCWRSSVTGELTVPGTPKPQTWHQVVDKASGLLYYWCPATGETTTTGEPKPGPHGRHAAFAPKEDRDMDGKSKKGDKEEELTVLSMYNNPLGYLLLGMAVFGIVFQNVKLP